MPQYNTTIEDYSPIISYSSDWSAGSSKDGLADLYSDSSFTLTQTNSGTASFIFNGTSFMIFGAKRGNHGFYEVSVDGQVFPPENGQSADPGLFQVPLFTSPLLSQGLHTVTLTNQGSTFVDIDFITLQSSVGEDSEQLGVTTVQDTDPSFVYYPPEEWGTNPPSLGTYSGSTGHGTASPGDGLYLYGPVGPQGSPFSVTLDAESPRNYTANKQFFQAQVLLYSATNLGPGKHVVKVTYEPSQLDQIFAVDFANVYTTPSTGSVLSSSGGSSTSSFSLSGGAIAGIVIALLFVLSVLAGFLFFLRRRRSRKNRVTLIDPIQSPPQRSNQDIVAIPGTYPRTRQYSSAAAQPSVRYPSTVGGSDYASRVTSVIDTHSQAWGGSDAEFSPTHSVSINCCWCARYNRLLGGGWSLYFAKD
ncbi:hypothetical protein GGX14DRAFT_599650 [Mycena pura]|uniref:Transmembrane protein n=1 Tax=Mycena pura TaxID=153505 RepID=A0AAD6VNC4_9AGAR|nr:hypothetical protein GGX14DRAFT_599650 [Mycena pura]